LFSACDDEWEELDCFAGPSGGDAEYEATAGGPGGSLDPIFIVVDFRSSAGPPGIEHRYRVSIYETDDGDCSSGDDELDL